MEVFSAPCPISQAPCIGAPPALECGICPPFKDISPTSSVSLLPGPSPQEHTHASVSLIFTTTQKSSLHYTSHWQRFLTILVLVFDVVVVLGSLWQAREAYASPPNSAFKCIKQYTGLSRKLIILKYNYQNMLTPFCS